MKLGEYAMFKSTNKRSNIFLYKIIMHAWRSDVVAKHNAVPY